MANKESRSVQKQIALLRRRGMIIEDEEFASLHLSHISYYRLKGYWWDMQKDKEQHIFEEGSIFEVATFGTLSKIYKNIGHQLPEKAKIANDFGLNLHTELSSWLEAISYLRNIVAHHSRVWSRNMVKRPMDIKNPKGIWLQNPLSEFAKKKPYLIITSMLYLCNAINAGDTYKKKIISLIADCPDIPIYKIGFPNHWNKELIWQ